MLFWNRSSKRLGYLRRSSTAAFLVFIALLLHTGSASGLQNSRPCQITIVDQSNHWPVPMVELKTNHHVSFVSDNAGRIAFDLPELMGQETWFSVSGHGYSVAADGFGMRGVRLTPTTGGELTVKVNRDLPAKRLGRLTGAGLFAESQKLGLNLDWQDQGVLGCDSVQTAILGKHLHWGWGDTTIAKYPLGIFDMTGGVTSTTPIEKFEPPIGLRFQYFVDQNEKPRGIAPIQGAGPTWLGGYAVVADGKQSEKLVATYAKIEPPLETYQLGLCVWDPAEKIFKKHRQLWQKQDGGKPPVAPNGHSTRWADDEGKEWLLFGDPFPNLKVPATFSGWEDSSRWEPIVAQKTVKTKDGKEITPHRGSIAYNAFRDCWICIFCQYGGDRSFLGELWYAESPSPFGPWDQAVKVVTHDNYTFYNPLMHPEMVSSDSKFIVFEATYTNTFSGSEKFTPRYDYNQILYRLDLDELFDH